jgi:hypothetical protein
METEKHHQRAHHKVLKEPKGLLKKDISLDGLSLVMRAQNSSMLQLLRDADSILSPRWTLKMEEW